MSRQSRKLWLHAEILQNGYPVAKCRRLISGRANIVLSNSRRGDLRIPMYAENLHATVIEIRGGNARFVLDLPWEGRVSSRGLVNDIDRTTSKEESLDLEIGDFCSVAHDDLRLLIQVTDRAHLQPPEKSVVRVKGYREGVLPLLIEDRSVAAAVGIGMLASTILTGAFSMGLLNRPLPAKLKFEQLAPEYVLPFVDPEHFRLAPEALQEKLETRRYLPSVLRYYLSTAELLTGIVAEEASPLMASSVERFTKAHQERGQAIQKWREEDLGRSLASAAKGNQARLMVPSVLGESVEESLGRVVSKVTDFHKGLDEQLSTRRSITIAFDKDPEYDFQEYRKPPKVNEQAKAALQKIRVWKAPNEEEAVYLEGSKLATRAARASRPYNQAIAVRAKADRLESPIFLANDTSIFSVVAPQKGMDSHSKWQLVQAGDYHKPELMKKVREPTTGEIEPHLVERAIQKNQFDLQLCFETALRRNQATTGTMEWKWRIDTRGTIEDLELIRSTIKDPKMIRCVRQKISSWQLPRPRRGSVEVVYPFEFKPARG